MEFVIIDERDLNLKKRGYCWAENSQRFFDDDYWRYQQIVLDEDVNDIDNVIDSFADGTYPVCKGEDGKLYTVMFRVSEHEDGSYWYRPVIWEEVEKKGE